jgi:hypothetical protein
LLFAAQVVFSNWWLKRYRFGPMEWLWRGLTYGKLPPMRKDTPETELPLMPQPAIALAAAASEQSATIVSEPNHIP